MSQEQRKRGKPKGAKAVTQAERDMILRGLASGQSARQIAAFIGRGRATVYLAIDRMKRDGTDGQGLLPVQVLTPEGATDDRAS